MIDSKYQVWMILNPPNSPIRIKVTNINEVKEGEEPTSLSDTAPLWTKHPNECEKEQYLELVQKMKDKIKFFIFTPNHKLIISFLVDT